MNRAGGSPSVDVVINFEHLLECARAESVERLLLKEGNPIMSLVFQNIDPPPPSPPW
jgi:hypothetical protein